MLKKAFGSLFFHITGAIIGFLFQLLAAKLLGAKEYGRANYYLAFTMTIAILFFLGFQFFIPKVIHQKRDKNLFISKIITTIVCFFLLFSPLLFIFLLINKTDSNLIFVLLIISIDVVIVEIINSYYIGISEAHIGSFFKNFLLKSLNLIFFIGFYIFLKNYFSYIISLLIAQFTIIAFFFSKYYTFTKPDFKLIRSSFFFYIVQLTYFFYTPFSKILQGKFSNYESVAILSIAIFLGAIVNLLSINLANVALPDFSKAFIAKDFHTISFKFQYVARINTFLILPIAICLIINSDILLDFLGKDFSGGGLILSMILFSNFFGGFVGPNGSVLLMMNRQKYEIFNGLVMIAMGLLLGFWLGPMFYWGIAFSLAASNIMVNILKSIEVYREFKLVPYSIKVFTYIIILAMVLVLIFYFINGIKNIYVWGALNLFVFLPFYWVIFYFSPIAGDRELLIKFTKNIFDFFKK